jgi:hypothetical protein
MDEMLEDSPHPGVLARLKWGTLAFGVKSTRLKRQQLQMGTTNLLKVGRLGPRCAKVRRAPHPAPTGASAKRSSIHAASKVANVGAAGGPKLLKWGRLRARQGQICFKSAKVRPQAASHKKVFAPQKKVFAPRADQSC